MVKDEREIRIGVIGVGGIAQVSHLPAYARIPGVSVTALCDLDLAKGQRVATRFNVPHGDFLIKCRKRRHKCRRGVSLNQNQVGTIIGKNFLKPFKRLRRNSGKALIRLHNIQVSVRDDVEKR